MRRGGFWACGLLLACAVGCGDGKVRLHPAAGRLTVNGRPAEGATIVLHPVSGEKAAEMLRPGGTVDADGAFSLSTYAPGDGAPAGEYRAVVIWVEDPTSMFVKDRLGNRYTNPEQSPWRLTVNDSPTAFAPIDIRDPLLAPPAPRRSGPPKGPVPPSRESDDPPR